MLCQKALDLPFPFNRTSFMVLEEVLKLTPDYRLIRRNLYMVDNRSAGGFRLVKESDVYRDDGIMMTIYEPGISENVS